METEYINSILLAEHFILFVVKIVILYMTYDAIKVENTPNAGVKIEIFKTSIKLLLRWTIVYSVAQSYFMYLFSEDVDVPWYEFLSVADQIITGLFLIIYFKKEG